MLPDINVTKRHNSVSTQQVRSYVHPIKTENQLDWFKKICWGRNCQKILLTDVAEQIKPVYKTNCSRKKNFDRRTPTSVPKKFLQTGKNIFSQKDKDKDKQNKLKGIQENTSLSNIYWRFYWPGSYAPRGVIDQYICLQMGAPLFLLALLSTQTQEVCKAFLVKKQSVSTKKLLTTFQIFIFSSQFLHLL